MFGARFLTMTMTTKKTQYDSDTLLLVVDLVGTFVFAVEGGLAAVVGDLDLLGLTRVR
jgi:hypothetical protein